MKKWFITFCALGLISTQAQAADAASNQEEAQGNFVKYEVKVVNQNQYENLLADFKNNFTYTNIHSLKDISNKLQVSKVQLEKLITKQLNETNNKNSVETAAPSKDEAAIDKVESPEAAAPAPETSKKQEQASVPQVPVTEQPAQSVAPTTPSAPSKEKVETTKPAAPTAEEGSVSAFETKVVELTNAERAKHGLAPLKSYGPLMKVAHAKSQDMSTNNYFSHTSPTYGSPFDQIKAAGITYRAAGENIAQGQRTPEEVVQAWMNSEGHRANILNGSFTHIGVGYVEDGNYWTQQFIQM
ncbi:CAP domain-containing protein [Ureibacillus aquaedulcis]|uniref:CAP domain-containing protein n=1 Tax=Ureibacillus aquaedulcis TaxID=3058421 RepID=A0ABT8GMP1_9BACL|nr:CAP domain-containing protein [Ureibacillus sp. BA0131]MDN4492669.1 CAP domain-containing protein [Ureibacillus sp. BA0131]